MPAFWRSILTARCVLAAYGLVVAIGLLSTMLSQGDVQVVCHAGGLKLVVLGDNGDEQPTDLPSVACPLCQTVAPPPLVPESPPPTISPLAHAAAPMVIARLHALAGAPLPARGPPQS